MHAVLDSPIISQYTWQAFLTLIKHRSIPN
jgi:hypothetical protein